MLKYLTAPGGIRSRLSSPIEIKYVYYFLIAALRTIFTF